MRLPALPPCPLPSQNMLYNLERASLRQTAGQGKGDPLLCLDYKAPLVILKASAPKELPSNTMLFPVGGLAVKKAGNCHLGNRRDNSGPCESMSTALCLESTEIGAVREPGGAAEVVSTGEDTQISIRLCSLQLNGAKSRLSPAPLSRDCPAERAGTATPCLAAAAGHTARLGLTKRNPSTG